MGRSKRLKRYLILGEGDVRFCETEDDRCDDEELHVGGEPVGDNNPVNSKFVSSL